MRRGDIWRVEFGGSSRLAVIVASDAVIQSGQARPIMAVPIVFNAKPSLVTVAIPGTSPGQVADATLVTALPRGSFLDQEGIAPLSAVDQLDSALRASLDL